MEEASAEQTAVAEPLVEHNRDQVPMEMGKARRIQMPVLVAVDVLVAQLAQA
jgi:hypothetical protein